MLPCFMVFFKSYSFLGELQVSEENTVIRKIFQAIIIPVYALVTVLSVFLAGGYKLPSKITDAVKGIVFSTIAILVIYSLLPLDFRFSRAVVLLGGLSALIIIPLYRFLLAFTGLGLIRNPFGKNQKDCNCGRRRRIKQHQKPYGRFRM